jgi:hypothetical protein
MAILAPNRKGHFLLPVVLLAATRWIEYTGLRMVYPFMPEIARGLGVGMTAWPVRLPFAPDWT